MVCPRSAEWHHRQDKVTVTLSGYNKENIKDSKYNTTTIMTTHHHNTTYNMSQDTTRPKLTIGEHLANNRLTIGEQLSPKGFFPEQEPSNRPSHCLEGISKASRRHSITSLLQKVAMVVMLMVWANCAWAETLFELNFMNTTTMPEKPASVDSWSGYSLRNDVHGLNSGFTMTFSVSGPVKITLGGCEYATSTKNAQIKDGETLLKSLDIYTPKCYHNGGVATYIYNGGATSLTVVGAEYTPYIKVETIDKDYASNDVYDAIVAAGNATQLLQALNNANGTAEKRFKIFLPNGTYDLGTATKTAVSSYTTIIGESREGVIIRNTPTAESIDNTATLLASGSNIIMQNLTLQCVITESAKTSGAERGVALQDVGKNNYYKNVRLLGGQDTYYEKGSVNSRFDDCAIHGHVDFICGEGGQVWFEKCELLIEEHDKAYIAVPKTPTNNGTGYTFNRCTIDNANPAKDMSGKYYLGRGWAGTPHITFANCTYNISPATDRGDTNGFDKQTWASGSGTSTDNFVRQDAALTAPSATATPLPAPATVTKDGTSLSWTAVDDAAAYVIYKGGVYDQTVTTTSATVDAEGTYSVATMSAVGVIGEAVSSGMLNTTAEKLNQNTPDGWAAVLLPEITYHTDVTLPTEGEGALSTTGNNRQVIQTAIDAANTAGGGIVRIPSGTWLSGPLVMKSNVTLHLNAGAKLMALPFGGVDYTETSLDGEKYPWSGNNNSSSKKNYNMFISCADNSTNVVIEGEGETSVIDGQGGAWWAVRDNLGTRPPLIRFQKGSKFLFRNFKLQNAAGTNLSLSNSNGASHFTVHDVTIKNPSSVSAEATADGYSAVSHNTDGIPVWGHHVNIYNCTIDTGDDNVVFDSGSQYGHVWNCTFKRGHGASFGSYTVGVHHIIFEGITFQGTSQGFRIKTNRKERSGNDQAGTNGAVHDIICRNSTMTGVTEPITLTTHYESEVEDPSTVESATVGAYTPEFRDILFQNITATNPGTAYTGWNHQLPLMIYGLPELKIHYITFDNVKIAANEGKGAYLAYCENLTFTNGCEITGTTTPVTKKYEVGTVTGSFTASDLALVSGKESQNLTAGATYTITKDVDYTTSSAGGLTYSTSAEGVATVSDAGVITAVGTGTAKITVTQAASIYAGKSVEISVTVTGGAATAKEWNFSNWDAVTAGSMTNPLVVDGLSVYPLYDNSDTQKSAIDSNNKSIDGYSFTKRFKFGGQSTSAKAGTGYLKFDVTGPTDIVVYGMCGSSSATSDIYLSTECRSTSNYLKKWESVSGSAISKNEYSYSGDATTIYLYCSTNSANIYCIKATPSTSSASNLTAVTTSKDISAGSTYTITKDVDYTTSSTGAIIYESSNTSVATVSDAGVITAVAAGTATITITQAADATYAAGSCVIAVTVEAAITYPITATWNFAKTGWGSASSTELTANEGTALTMQITNTGIRDNGNALQCNTGTVFKVPVLTTSDEITITNFGNAQYNLLYTIGTSTTEYSDNTKTFPPSSADVEAGYVVVTCKNTGYVKAITVVQQEPAPASTAYTFGIGRTKSGDVWSGNSSTGEDLKGTAPDGVTVVVANTETTNGLGTCSDAVYGSETSFSQSYAHKGTGSNVEAGPLGFNVTIPSGKVLNISSIYYDLITRKGKTTGIRLEVRKGNATGALLYKQDEVTYAANTASSATISTSAVSTLQKLTGDVCLMMYWKENTGSPYLAIKDFQITATLTDKPARTFQTIELDFQKITTLPATPEGVTSMEGTCRNDEHGLNNFQMVVPVDGPVKITIGGCQYSGTKATIKTGEKVLKELDVVTPGCYHNGGMVTCKYNKEEATTLTIIGAQYTPYIKIEACDYTPVCETPAQKKGAYVAGTTSWTYELSTSTETAYLKYKIGDGDEVTIEKKSDNVDIPYGSTVEVWAIDHAGVLEESEHLVFTADAQPQMAAPSIACDDDYKVTITTNDKTSGAKTYYTTDGTDPTAESTPYSAAFSVTETTTIKAVTILAGYVNSTITTQTITFKALKPVAALAADRTKVTITNKETGGTVYYTVDGSEPTTEHYDGMFTEASHDIPVYGSCQIKSFTVKAGVPNSDVVTYFCRTHFNDIDWDLTGTTPFLGTSKTNFETGVVVDDEGNAHLCAKGDISNSIDVKTKWNDKDHGYSGWTASIPVEGNVDIYLGNCQYGGGSLTINPGDITLQQLGKTEKNCYHQNTTANKNVAHYIGGPTTLTITSNGVYVPYFAVKDVRSASDLTKVNGDINVIRNESYTLAEGTDFTGTGTFRYVSSNPSIATVDATGKITAGSTYGQTTITVYSSGSSTMKPGKIQFTVRVTSAAGQTHAPEVSIADDGAVTITKSSAEDASDIYYTLDGSIPTDVESETCKKYTSTISAAEASGKVIKVIAVTTDKSPSDVVKAYCNISGTFTWAWNEGGTVSLVPEVTGDVAGAYDENSKATYNTESFTQKGVNPSGNDSQKFAGFESKKIIGDPEEASAITFNIIPVAGVSFKPTSVSYDVLRNGTSSGLLDVKLISESNTYNLYTQQKPRLDQIDTYTPTLTEVEGAAEEWALKMYLYSLSKNKNWGIRNVVISGVFSGVEYDGTFYNIYASPEPAAGGSVSHTPSASKVVPGKKVTFTATPNTGYKFVKWVDMDTNEKVGESTTYTVNSLSSNLTLEAQFEALPKITFTNNNGQLTGTVPAITYTNSDHTFTIPENTTLYREGWAVTGWKNGDEVYLIGSTQTFDADVTLTPVVTQCDKALTDVNAATTVRWPFDLTDGAPIISSDPITMTYTKSITVDGSMIDVPLKLSGAKMDNNDARVNRLDDGVNTQVPAKGGQINDNGVLNIPAVPGMVVKLKASDKIDLDNSDNVTNFTGEGTLATVAFLEGETAAKGEPTKTEKLITYTYTGDATSLNVKITKAGSGASWGFFEYLEVEYPVLPDVLMENSIVSEALAGIPAGQEKAENAGTVEKSATTHPNTGSRYKSGDVVTVTAIAKYGYYIKGFKVGENSLTMTKVEPSAEATQPTKATATYTVGATTGTVTVEYERLPMGKVRLETDDIKLGDVDFPSANIYENFYTKGSGYVESYFVVGRTVAGSSDAADDYVCYKWLKSDGTDVTASIGTITVTAETQTFTALFQHGVAGTVTFDITDARIDTEISATANNLETYTFTDTSINKTYSNTPLGTISSYSFSIPNQYTLFWSGYTLKEWRRKDNVNAQPYELGKNYSFSESDNNITLIPVFEKNPTNQNNRVNEPIMTYNFGTGKGIRAQKVKIAKNAKTFWNTHVEVITKENGIEYTRQRDVALYVETGTKGFIRNGDMAEWASFGEGTKFYIASCAGTKVEICCYAPITSTNFGGDAFVLDEEKSDTKNHLYVYSCTTQKTDARVPVVIGDDYSYYKYIKVYSKKADRVNLHTGIDDKVRGKVYAPTAPENSAAVEPRIELEDGGYSFEKGERVTFTFQRGFGFEFDKIVDPDKIGSDGNPLAVVKMLDNGKVAIVGSAGTEASITEVSENTGDGKNSWGSTSTVFMLKKTEQKAVYDVNVEADTLRTMYEVSFNISTHRRLQVCFKEKPTYYVTFNPGQYATGTAPAAVWLEKGDKFEIPQNHTLYYEGNTLKYWVDSEYDYSKTKADNVAAGCHIYNINETPALTKNWETAPKEDYNLRLFPVFEKNTFTILDVQGESGWTATWPFAKTEGAPVINFERSSGILVTRLENGKTATDAGYDWIDLKADLDASDKVVDGNKVKGKFFNDAEGAESRCQINNNSVMTFPTTKNCDISLYATNNFASDAGSRTVVAGSTSYDAGKTAKVTYQGDDATQNVEFKNDGKYYTKFTVTYKPQTVTKPELTSVKYGDVALDLTTLKANHQLKNVNATVNATTEAMATVSATADNGSVTVTQPTVTNPLSTITLKTTGGVIIDTYTINFTPTLPSDAPAITFSGFEINGQSYENGATVEEMPVSGYIKLKFNRTMKATQISSSVEGSSAIYTAEQGKELVFKYWNLSPSTMSNFYVTKEYNQTYKIFEDIYGNVYTEKDLSLHLRFASTTIPVEHRTFDYVVGKDGSLEDAIATANADTGTDRYYVFIPDGDYKLEGNEDVAISNTTSDGTTPCDRTGKPTSKAGKTVNNGMTIVSRKNVSLIGQSMNGVVLHNDPDVEGIGYTATIHVGKNAKDFYAEELSLRNDFPYWDCMNGGSNAARAVCFWDQGNKTILKNVSMMSYQDTYYSSNASNDHRAYWEDCTLGGIIDWACGDGDVWWENCDIVIRDRSGNNFAAPHTEPGQQWGYVYNKCRFIPEPGVVMQDLKDKTWTLARPWGAAGSQEPACTFLNSKISVLPKDAGWGPMSGGGMVLRFHEYKSGDANGNLISLGARSLAAANPAAGSDECILTDELAAKYTINNVLGGGDGFTPQSFTLQIDAASATSGKDANNSLVWNDEIETDDDRLQWNTCNMALCYFVFKKDEGTGKWIYLTNVAQEEGNPAKTGLSIENYGNGIYCVRAANQRGGLGAATKAVEYKTSKKYTLTIKQVGTTEGYGWSTICLPYNSKVPAVNAAGEAKDLKVYAANGVSDGETEQIVSSYALYLKSVYVINKDMGYVVYGPVGTYEFSSSSHTSETVTILRGNSGDEAIAVGNNNCYVLANKTTYGLGFYKYSGKTLAAHRAWLPVDMVESGTQSGVENQAKAITFIFEDDDVPTGFYDNPIVDLDEQQETIVDLHGRRINRADMKSGAVYIVNGKKVYVK